MKENDRERKIRKALFALRQYIAFFLLMCFIVTCCMLLFLNSLSLKMGLSFDEAGIEQAAKLTFVNILWLSLLCTVIDGIRRKFMVERPVKNIVKAADRIMKGDFSARVQGVGGMDSAGGFDVIADCFNKMAEELNGIETLRTDFIANVSHELKTPLAVIQNYGTILQQPELPEKERLEYARKLTRASRRLADLISNILKLNKLENQQIFPVRQTVDLGEQLCQCLLSFENAWEEKALEIDTDIQENVLVETDAELLTLVWNNLFSNAVKFTEPGGKLFLGLRTEGEMAVVQVTDTGCGISPEVGRHLFEKFYQGDSSHASEGNGLGLALVKRVVDIVGGDISVESQVGKGSTFTVRLRRKNNIDGTMQETSA